MDTVSKIFLLLDEKNKKQNELSTFLGISKGTISEWKNGKSKSYAKYLPQIAEFFDVSIEYLTGKSENKKNYKEDITDEDIKFALFGGEEGVSDEAYEEVKEFVKFVKQKYKNKW